MVGVATGTVGSTGALGAVVVVGCGVGVDEGVADGVSLGVGAGALGAALGAALGVVLGVGVADGDGEADGSGVGVGDADGVGVTTGSVTVEPSVGSAAWALSVPPLNSAVASSADVISAAGTRRRRVDRKLGVNKEKTPWGNGLA